MNKGLVTKFRFRKEEAEEEGSPWGGLMETYALFDPGVDFGTQKFEQRDAAKFDTSEARVYIWNEEKV